MWLAPDSLEDIVLIELALEQRHIPRHTLLQCRHIRIALQLVSPAAVVGGCMSGQTIGEKVSESMMDWMLGCRADRPKLCPNWHQHDVRPPSKASPGR